MESISLTAASKMAGKSSTTLRRWATEKLVKATKNKKGSWRFDPDSLRTYLATSEPPLPRQGGSTEVYSSGKAVQFATTELIQSLRSGLEREQKINDDLRQDIKDLKVENKHVNQELVKIVHEVASILKNQHENKPSDPKSLLNRTLRKILTY